MDYEEAISTLEATGKYRVLRQMTRSSRYAEDDGAVKKIGIILDVETTGTIHPKKR